MRIKECFRSLKHIFLNCLQDFGQFFCQLIHCHYNFFSCVTANDNNLTIFNIFWSDFDTCRDSDHFLLAEFPSRALFRIIDGSSVSCCLQYCKQFISFVKHTLFVLCDRDHSCLNWRNVRRKYQTTVISMYHDDGSDDTCGQSPGCLIYAVQFVFFIRIADSIRIRKRISEEMTGS